MQLNSAKVRVSKELTVDRNRSIARASVMADENRNDYVTLKIDQLIPFERQARKIFSEKDINKLAATVKEYGIKQPLTIIRSPNKPGLFEIVSGERRWRAAHVAGLKQIPCILLKDEKKADEIAIIENLQRKDLHPLEMMKAFEQLLNKGLYSKKSEIARKLGLNKSFVSEILDLKRLPEETKNALITMNIKARRILRKLLSSEAVEHKLIIENYLKKRGHGNDNDSEKVGQKGIIRKSTILTISLVDGKIVINKNKLKALSQEHARKVRELIEQVMDESSPRRTTFKVGRI